MDSIFIGASVLTILSAARKTSGALKRLKRMRDAPQEFEALLSDIDNFELYLEAIKTAPWSSDIANDGLRKIINDATDKLLNIHKIVEYKLTEAGESSKVDRWQWTNSEKNIQKVKDCIKDIKADLNIFINVERMSVGHRDFTSNRSD